MTLLGEIFFATQELLAEVVPDLAQTPNIEYPWFNSGTGQWETLLFIHMLGFDVFYINAVRHDTAPLEISFAYADYWLRQIPHPVGVYHVNYPGSTEIGEYVIAVTEN